MYSGIVVSRPVRREPMIRGNACQQQNKTCPDENTDGNIPGTWFVFTLLFHYVLRHEAQSDQKHGANHCKNRQKRKCKILQQRRADRKYKQTSRNGNLPAKLDSQP